MTIFCMTYQKCYTDLLILGLKIPTAGLNVRQCLNVSYDLFC